MKDIRRGDGATRRHGARLWDLCAFLALTACLNASSTQVWEMNSYQDFVHGHFQGISLTRDGRLMLGPKMESLFSSDQAVVWGVAPAPDGSLYVATGHRGRLYRIDKSGKSTLIWTADQPEIFAVAVDAKGAVYAATSPDGKIYRIEGSKATEYFAPQAKYIWSLAIAPDGALYAGTGDQGKVFRVDAAGKGEVFYATGQSHVTGLAVDREGRVLAGTEPNGILYRISGKEQGIRSLWREFAGDSSDFRLARRNSLRRRHGRVAFQTNAGNSAKQSRTAWRPSGRHRHSVDQRNRRERTGGSGYQAAARTQ